ncbi:MAG: hypothetical protein ABFC67_04840 [Mizugakiibacter sp.]|uniref:hypothetical protein n=1 Tax=Mizugakiibacter sp. TaxID=1972610 RepID=UPI00320F831F
MTNIPNRPAGKPVFDFDIGNSNSDYARVVLDCNKSADGLTLYCSGWAYVIDANGVPILDTATAAPIATADGNNTVALSGVLAQTHTLYDGWCKYMPASGQTIDAQNLPTGWTSGSGAPTGTPAYGTGYYDTAADQPWMYTEGLLNAIGRGYADQLAAQIDTAAKLAALGI